MALGLLAFIVTMLLGELNRSQQHLAENRDRQEALSLATMAMQTGQSHVELNGQVVDVSQTDSKLVVYASGQEVMRIERQ
ncbi:competence type IV pilus minor pilin ComGE [Streptococcus caprae]|uniref:Competence type IV pilus minor pilin ComGE n=1 Tax=Streptococcus caprae TaxID=1640501 RepID=A0ABV8CXC9_9STRE